MPHRTGFRTAACLLATSAIGLTAILGSGAAGATAPAAAQPGGLPSQAYRAGDYAHGQAMSILPPGENGTVKPTQLVGVLSKSSYPPNSQDQLGKYENLLYHSSTVTDKTLGNFYDDESFGVKKADVLRTEDPTSPDGTVKIIRDNHDVPHIYGSTPEAGAFGAGYAQAEDRLFLMDVLRHYGEGTLSSFIGPSCADEQMDHDQLLLAPYTEKQANAQVADLPKEYGPQGQLAENMIDAYVAGINAWIAHTQTLTGLNDLDANYKLATVSNPTDWSPADVVAVAGLIGGIFGKGGGGEIANAALDQYLQHKLGKKAGAKAFKEFKEQNDPGAPTTVVNKRFPYESVPAHVKRSLTALPDHPKAALKGGPADLSKGCGGSIGSPFAVASIAALADMPAHMSNAIVVDAKDTKAHHPIAVFGPQVSYFSPQILSEEEIDTPGYHAEGASFPGTGIVELGRGVDYAWSATSAGSDIIDQRLEKVCKPGGGKPAAEGKFYSYKGHCLAMQEETFTESAVPLPGGPGAPATITHHIYLTRHGVVQGWTTAQHGKPVAVVNQRSTFNHDVDSVVGFLRWGEPSLTHSVASWEKGAARIGYTFNWFYVDSKHDAYYASGRDPIRAKGVNPNLPTWGTGKAEWRGFLSPSRHVHQTDPKQGFFVSWNNKPAPGFSAADDQYGYGPTYRSQMLVTQLKHQLKVHHHRLTRAEVVRAMETAASQDLDGLTVAPQLLAYEKGHHHSKGVTTMLATLRRWTKNGAHRKKAKTSDAQYQAHAAVAIMDELEPRLIEAVYNRLLKGGGGITGSGSTGGASTPGYAILPMQFVNTPNSGNAHLGSSFDGGWEGYMQKTLQQLRGRHPVDRFTSVITSRWCTSGPASCRAAITKALNATYNALKKVNGSATVSSWTKDTALAADESSSNNSSETMPQFDAIAFRALGVETQPNIDWQNRPTFQQVVQFPAHRK
jgi:acyl-homoserine lactone acylase PvdQ